MGKGNDPASVSSNTDGLAGGLGALGEVVMQAGDRFAVSTQPMKGGRLAWSFARNLVSQALFSAANEWPPAEVLIVDRDSGVVVHKLPASGMGEAARLVHRVQHDLDALDVETFVSSWGVRIRRPAH